ncbi:MAG: malonyl-CoA synthase [Paracoccaceae bacterium]|nr:malonyl-CoA synthase [Paracoccaceae bacterium]
MANYLYDGIFGSFASDPKTFLRTPSEQISYAEFTALTNRLANCLAAAGVKPGDRVAIQAEKSVTQLALYAATVKAGGVYLPLNTGYTAHELDYFLSDAKPALIVVDAATQDSITALVAGLKAVLMTLNKDETGSLTELAINASDQFEAIPRNSEDLAAILYTSGTTGRSKGAKICHRNLLSNAIVLQETWQFTGDDTLLHMLPIYHTHGLFVACNLLAMVGGSMIFLPKFTADVALEWMPKATSMMGVPTFYTRLLDAEGFTRQAAQHMRLFISGSAPLLAETHKRFEDRTGQLIVERYGMTETNMSTSNPYHGARIAGTVGMPLAGVDIRIADSATGLKMPNGEIGIIELKGNNVFLGYWEMPNKTAESFRDDGYFITGDMAQQDENGYITIVGRDKDLIISGGLNIYPKEVEGLIDDIDGVLESAVIGVPHKDFGEAVVAIVVKSENALESHDISRFLKNKLAKFKQPKIVTFMTALPRNTMGKIQKAHLRKTYETLFQSEEEF